MMHHASQGMRNALRKGSVNDLLVWHIGPPGSGTTTNSTSSQYLYGNLRNLLHIAKAPFTSVNSLSSIRPRSPPHRLFSFTKNALQTLFANLTTPGFRAPNYLAQSGTRSFHNASVRGDSIQRGLSFVARASLKNNALHRQGSMFLPRAPTTPPPRCGGITQLGLGSARNFTTGRPIFQQVAENIPIAGRALYEVDWDFEMRNEQTRAHLMAAKKPKHTRKSKEMLKPTQTSVSHPTISPAVDDRDPATPSERDLDCYFPSAATVTTFLYVPLAPKLPLAQHPAPDELTLLPLSDLTSLHRSYATHNLRVKTLFNRLEQGDVWSRGVSYGSYSEGLHNRIQDLNGEEEGICTNLKLAFEGWTKAEVRSVIGESGTGWCVLEEVCHDQVSETLSEASFSLASSLSRAGSPTNSEGLEIIDPSHSLIIPKLAFSSSFLASPSQLSSSSPSGRSSGSGQGGLMSDYLVEDMSSSSSSSYSDLSDLV